MRHKIGLKYVLTVQIFIHLPCIQLRLDKENIGMVMTKIAKMRFLVTDDHHIKNSVDLGMVLQLIIRNI